MKTLQLAATAAVASIATALVAFTAAADPPQPSTKWSIHVVPQQPRLTEEVVARITPGLTEDAVKALIGPPERTTRFPRSNMIAWEYGYRDPSGYDATFSVIFNGAGLVVSRVSIPWVG